MPDLKSASEYLVPMLNTTEYSENEGSDARTEEGILDENPAKMVSTISLYSHKNNKANNFKIMNSNNLILKLDDGGSEEDEEEEKRACLYKQTYEANLLVYLENVKENLKELDQNAQQSFMKKHQPNSYNNSTNYNKDKILSPGLPSKSFHKISPKYVEKKYRKKNKIKALKNNGLLSLGCFFESHIPIDKQDEDLYKINTIGIKDLKKHPHNDFIQFHKKHLSLVYNYAVEETNEMLLYQTGAQINNFQPNNYQDLSILTNFSKFQENGGYNSGYLLKPANFLHETKKDNIMDQSMLKPKIYLNVVVFSASQLKCSENNKSVSPWIEIGLKGSDLDEKNNKIYRTMVVSNNGYNPIFEDKISCEFVIHQPELSVLYFQVWDHVSELEESKFLGWYGVPVNCIRGGFRIVPLRDLDLSIIDKSLLFCKVEIRTAESG